MGTPASMNLVPTELPEAQKPRFLVVGIQTTIHSRARVCKCTPLCAFPTSSPPTRPISTPPPTHSPPPRSRQRNRHPTPNLGRLIDRGQVLVQAKYKPRRSWANGKVLATRLPPNLTVEGLRGSEIWRRKWLRGCFFPTLQALQRC